MDVLGAIFAFFAVLIGFAIWLTPMVLIIGSDRTSGKEKLAWVLAMLFVSWFAWIFYWLLAPIRDPREANYGSSHRRRYRDSY